MIKKKGTPKTLVIQPAVSDAPGAQLTYFFFLRSVNAAAWFFDFFPPDDILFKE